MKKKDKFKVGDLVKFVHYDGKFSKEDIGIILKQKIERKKYVDIYDNPMTTYIVLWVVEEYITEGSDNCLEKLS